MSQEIRQIPRGGTAVRERAYAGSGACYASGKFIPLPVLRPALAGGRRPASTGPGHARSSPASRVWPRTDHGLPPRSPLVDGLHRARQAWAAQAIAARMTERDPGWDTPGRGLAIFYLFFFAEPIIFR